VEQPLPDDPRDDERDRHRKEKLAAEERLALDLLIEEGGGQEAEHGGTEQEERREDDRVSDVRLEAKVFESRS
jgi:hypothetical protein